MFECERCSILSEYQLTRPFCPDCWQRLYGIGDDLTTADDLMADSYAAELPRRDAQTPELDSYDN